MHKIFMSVFWFEVFYNRKSEQRLIRERSLTKKPSDFNHTSIYQLPTNGSNKRLFIGSTVQDQ